MAPPDPAPEADLGPRLIVFGTAAVAVGAGFVLLAAIQLLLALAGALFDAASAAGGVALYALVGGVLVACGIGSIRRQRWVRPVMLLISGTWLLVGLVACWLVFSLAPEMLLAAQVDPSAGVLVQAALVGAALGGGVVLPAAFYWAYRDPRVEQSCRRHDPRPSWTDRCPAEVLTLSLALAASAVSSLPLLVHPVVPLFGRLATGWSGRLVLAAGIAMCAWLAWSTFRLQAAGWWATAASFVLFGASGLATFVLVDPLELYRQLGYPEDLLASLPSIGEAARTAASLGTLALTLAGLGWMLRIRRHFR